MKLKPFMSFYGGKWRLAPKYHDPEYDTIVEPFCGGAGYSTRHHTKKVILVERDPVIAETWRYLLRVSPTEILTLPNMRADQTVDDLDICPEAKLLIGWWLNAGVSQPCKQPSAWAKISKEFGGPGHQKDGLPDGNQGCRIPPSRFIRG